MNARLFLVAIAVLMPLGGNVVFAQSYDDQGPAFLRPGEAPTAAQSDQTPYYSTPPTVGVVTLKPGQTFATSTPQDYGSVQAGATPFNPDASAKAKPAAGG